MKKYTNLIVIGLIIIVAVGYYISTKISFYDALLATGYYEEKITIINTADILGHMLYNEGNKVDIALGNSRLEMGMALTKTAIDDIRSKNKHSLLLDSGDFFAGSTEANINEGEGIVIAANLMGYDAMGLGQHDFSWGFDRIQEIDSEVEFPLLAANVYKDGKPAFKPYSIFEVGGKKIGVFGLTSDQFLQDLQRHNEVGITYEDPIQIAKSIVAELQAAKVDSIVLLSHIGLDYDSEEIAVNVQGIDLILSGRGFVLLKKEQKVEDTYLAEAGSFSSYVGAADMYFRNGKVKKVKWNVSQLSDQGREDPAVAEVVTKYYNMALEVGKEIIGTSTVDLDGNRSNVRTKETNFANLLADAMRIEGGAEIALFNGGAIRESVAMGDIRLYDINKPLPYVNSLVTIELKGSEIYEAIENGLETWPNGAHNGGFPQVSGIEYVIDGSKLAGDRLQSITKDGQPLDKDKVYSVAVTDYLYAGGDNYTMLEDAKVISRGDLLVDVIARHIIQLGEISTQVEGRITIVNQRYK